MARSKYVVLLPMARHDGNRVSKAQLDDYLSGLFNLAGGYTVAGTVVGAYRMRSGKKQQDRCLEIWIVLEESRESELKHWLANVGADLGQEAMYFEKSGARVTFIRPRPRRATKS
ncbi:MAG: hypothetical protein L0Y71_15115 [Gemmataceae bacterium]|nr:hypothetical protein [Gemmataceae bacterium]